MNVADVRVQHARVVVRPEHDVGKFLGSDVGDPANGKSVLVTPKSWHRKGWGGSGKTGGKGGLLKTSALSPAPAVVLLLGRVALHPDLAAQHLHQPAHVRMVVKRYAGPVPEHEHARGYPLVLEHLDVRDGRLAAAHGRRQVRVASRVQLVHVAVQKPRVQADGPAVQFVERALQLGQSLVKSARGHGERVHGLEENAFHRAAGLHDEHGAKGGTWTAESRLGPFEREKTGAAARNVFDNRMGRAQCASLSRRLGRLSTDWQRVRWAQAARVWNASSFPVPPPFPPTARPRGPRPTRQTDSAAPSDSTPPHRTTPPAHNPPPPSPRPQQPHHGIRQERDWCRNLLSSCALPLCNKTIS